MKAPEFWNRPNPNIAACLLYPLSGIWRLGAAIRNATATPEKIGVPVICVGNASLGGAGKTPVAIDLARAMADKGMRPHIVSRGFGGTETGPIRVDPAHHDAAQVGDEPLLLAHAAPTWVSRSRAAGAQAAEKAGASHIILDDGYQNPHLHQDIRVLVVDTGVGFGNGLVFPAGPLREPASTALARADVVVSMGSGPVPNVPDGATSLAAQVVPNLPDGLDPALPCVAFAGIGRPEKFFDTARSLGLTIVKTRAFPDHCRYDASDIQELRLEAEELSAQLITTEKDAVRLPPADVGLVHAIPITLSWKDGAPLADAVLERLAQ